MAYDAVPRVYGTPVFWFPRLWGSMTDGGSPLRTIGISSSSAYGYGVESRWGLFETLGQAPPDGTDASYRLDYYSERGPGFGLDANYTGGFVSETTLQPWSFDGRFTSYIVYDDGEDRLGKRRRRIDQEGEVRGRVRWDHQHFLSDNWQVQARLGYVSDGTFVEEWFRNEFRNGLTHETSLNVRRSQGTEVFSAFANIDLSSVATTAR